MNPEFELREQDRWLPIANVARLMKNTLPASSKVSKDAKECMQECVSEFISFVTSEASDRCMTEKRKTINGEDILVALYTLGFENYAEVLKIYLAKYRHQQTLKQEKGEVRSKKKKQPKVNEEQPVKDTLDEVEVQQSLSDNEEQVYQHPMDEESVVVINNNTDIKHVTPHTHVEKLRSDEVDKSAYDAEYVSQLYEQNYTDLPLTMGNPDYHGVGASGSILTKSESVTEKVAVGPDVHLGNHATLDQINSQLNKSEEESSQLRNTSRIQKDTNRNSSFASNEARNSEFTVTKTPANTGTSDLLLLNDNVTDITEREEIVGLTNGHSGMYGFD